MTDAGNDAGCAARMAAALPPTLASTHLTTRSLYAAFDAPADPRQVLTALRTIAASAAPDALDVATALEWMTPANGGIDVGNPLVRGMLDSMATGGAITTAQASALKALAERPADVTADDVSRAMRPSRVAAGIN